jgi:hypothetical protein
LVKKHSGAEALLRLEHYLRPQALTTWAACLRAGSGEAPLPPFIAPEVAAIDLNRPIDTSAGPRVMKQILLRVSAVFSEVRFRELPQPLRGHFLSTRKIMLP